MPNDTARAALAVAASLAALAAPAAPAAAQVARDSVLLPGIVVTADRVPRPLATTVSSVTVVEGNAIRAAGVVHLLDALRAIPGVNVVRAGSAGAQTSLFLRGGESDYVRVLVDGVPMNDPGGAFDLSALTTDDVERIEVVRGPTSVLYGSDAVSGVVQVFTRRAREHRDVRLSARGGTYGTTDLDASVGMRRDASAFTLGLARHRSDGMLTFNNGYRNTVASAHGATVLPKSTRLTFSARRGDNSFEYPTDGAGNVVDRNAHRGERRLASAAELTRPFGARVNATLALSALELHGRTDDAADSPADTLGFFAYRSVGAVRRRDAEARVDLRLGHAQTVTLGTSYALEAQRSADSSNYDVSLNRFAARRITRAAFGQLVGGVGRLSYSVGGRYDDNDAYGPFRTARLGAAARLWDGARLRAGAGSAFKAPTFLESFNTAFSVGNRALRPERSRSWEAGFEQGVAEGRVTLALTWFDQRFRDLIQYTFRSPTDPNYFNIAAASTRGLEGEARLAAARGIQLWTNATALRTRVDDAGFQEGSGAGATFVRGQRLLRRAPLVTSVGAAIDRIPRTRLQLVVTRVGERDDRDFSTFPATPVVLDPYTRADVGGEIRLGGTAPVWRDAAVTWRIENAFNAGYEEVAHFRGPGRVLLAGVRLGTVR